MIDLRGIIVPVITPFDGQENFNEAEMRVQINRQIEAGIHGIFCLGTNGEFYAMSESEKERVIAVCAETTDHRRPVFAGTGCASTLETIRLSRRAKELGADVLSVVCPYFALASQDDIYRHYAEIASAVDMPVVLYNIPARTGNAIAPSTLGRLTGIPNIVAIKDSSGNFDNMLQYIEYCRGTKVQVISGTDSLILGTCWPAVQAVLLDVQMSFPIRWSASMRHLSGGTCRQHAERRTAFVHFEMCFSWVIPIQLSKRPLPCSIIL